MQQVAAAPLLARAARPARAALAAGLAVAVFALAAIATLAPYRPGEGIGYQLGLWGGLAMLALFAYPIRKRLPRLERAGAVRHWFSLHMALGLAGPLLILLHSRFQLESLNATVAFWSMVLVASSGVVGRFLYRHVHHGLYGRRASLQELRAHAGIDGDDTRSWLKHLPGVRRELEAFGERAERQSAAAGRQLATWLAMELHALRARARARRALRDELPCVAEARGWDEATYRRRRDKGGKLVDAWISHAASIARFGACERLFALWHVVHLPFVVLLVVSAAVHVLYVHMY